MKKFSLPLILFLIVVLEGVALKLLPATIAIGETYLIPHWVFIVLLFYAMFYDREHTYYSIIYAAIFGLLIDIVYTNVLGVYMFSYALVIYLLHEIAKVLHGNIIVMILLGAFGIAIVDVLINTIYLVIGVSDVIWSTYLLYRLLPTVLLNLLFLIPFYPLMTAQLKKWQREHRTKHISF